jgi:hypothetical protein
MMETQATAIDLGNGYAQLVEEYPELHDFKPAWLGDYNRQVATARPGVYFARRITGQVFAVVNDLHIPAIPDLPVIVGQSQDGTWHILRARRYDSV